MIMSLKKYKITDQCIIIFLSFYEWSVTKNTSLCVTSQPTHHRFIRSNERKSNALTKKNKKITVQTLIN